MLLAMVWVLWQNSKQRKKIMGALANLQTAVTNFNALVPTIVAAINASKSAVSEADVQAQADALNVGFTAVKQALETPAPVAQP